MSTCWSWRVNSECAAGLALRVHAESVGAWRAIATRVQCVHAPLIRPALAHSPATYREAQRRGAAGRADDRDGAGLDAGESQQRVLQGREYLQQIRRVVAQMDRSERQMQATHQRLVAVRQAIVRARVCVAAVRGLSCWHAAGGCVSRAGPQRAGDHAQVCRAGGATAQVCCRLIPSASAPKHPRRFDALHKDLLSAFSELGQLVNFYQRFYRAYPELLREVRRRWRMLQDLQHQVRHRFPNAHCAAACPQVSRPTHAQLDSWRQQLAELHEGECARREQFFQDFGRFLPPAICPGMTVCLP